ncbi:hypothetical protein GCM10027082_21400 [Comamonas humi]
MAMLSTRLLRREQIAEGTMAFHFEKPAGFGFVPGQAMDLVLRQPASAADPRDGVHAFSIVSAPHENDLTIATRMRDTPFKNALGRLPIGSAIQIDGPFGELCLRGGPEHAAVCIAGGIGITPFMSMLRHAAHEQSPQPLRLVYANHRPEEAAFLGELKRMEVKNPQFGLLATMTRLAHAGLPWSGHTGAVDRELLAAVAKPLPAPIFYVAGPPAMVESMQQVLADAGVPPEAVCSEGFDGY